MPQMFDVFISYSRDDLELVKPWVEELKKGGVSVFFDRDSLVGGVVWQGEITEAISLVKVVMFFISQRSLASNFVPKELALAVDMKKTILPILLEPTEVRGPIAFSIAGLQRLEAYDPDVSKVWRGIRNALKRSGVDWQSPQQRMTEGPEESPQRDAVNLRRPRKREIPLEKEQGKARAKGGLGKWLWLGTGMATAAALGVGLKGGMAGKPSADPSPGETKPVPKVEMAPVPRPVVVSFEEEAELTCRHYLEAAKDFNPAQTAYLDERVAFMGVEPLARAEVEALLRKSKERWPYHAYEILETGAAAEIKSGELAANEIRVRELKRNPLVDIRREVKLRIGTRPGPNGPVIVRMEEMPGSQGASRIVYDETEQEHSALSTVRRAVESGNSTQGMSPVAIGELYSDVVDYFGTPKTAREAIVAELQRFVKRWPVRRYEIKSGPKVTRGLGTAEVELEVDIEFTASDPRTGNVSKGRVRSAYELTYNEEGRALISGHREVERDQKGR